MASTKLLNKYLGNKNKYNEYTYEAGLFQTFSEVEVEKGLFVLCLFCNNFINC